MTDESNLRRFAEAHRLLAAALCQPEVAAFIAEDVPGRLRRAMAKIAPSAVFPPIAISHDDELLVAYTRLFIGPGHVPAPPYGSVYLESAGRVAGVSTIDVDRCYAEAGLGVASDEAELPDHAAIELEFSAHQLDHAADLTATGQVAEAESVLLRHAAFEQKLMLSWLPALGARMAESRAHPFYDAVGLMLQALPPSPCAGTVEA